MAIEYQFHIDTESSLDDVLSAVSLCFADTNPETRNGGGVVAAQSVEVRVVAFRGSELVAQHVEHPAISVLFRLNKFELEAARHAVARTVAQLFHQLAGDAVLTWNWERAAALRMGADLVISSDSDLKSELIHLLNVPSRVGTIPARDNDGSK